ncbi:bifunctional anthranilate synthase component II/anthranilate phosphoribosyltransferase [Helicobacter bilis]|uniref:Anthranilate phosphoribosyltransferase n=1 Tax=Helicobacter bilis TaxID=37372 RepID=A0A4U8UC92_9HELI|nr:bifunctional anthranilate synthase component II/anthranilate phosphoribosyltransferase [Helicobacter bilis]MCI7411622.1 bifunctional anthranilate synthase component II/anthranilate phosphoribosyltransferase [Helicobacter bilis]MDD7295876.1 bifunctional anthranilate synthase component II/anthranilate phosphoribosyltransferase [Helicobacter bilis]MDY4400633.1 bifunctional anthranilate synthase component II/anthranilate phosphoribosyltransferase [Helicobacter bilis]TLE08548.1 bifunctional anthr
MILLIDNYDSFTYNIYQLVARLGFSVIVKRNDAIDIETIRMLKPTHIILGPGPNSPKDSKICLDIIAQLKDEYPILGICLGHEAILYAFDVPIVNAKSIVHGKVSPLTHTEDGIFTNIPQHVQITRYHSLVAKREQIPDYFHINAVSDDGEVMAVAHKQYPLFGLQFHPESIGTQYGEKMILNFIHYKRRSIPIKLYLQKLAHLENLSFVESYDLMECIAENDLTPAQLGSLITSFYHKGPSGEELAAFASLLISKAKHFEIQDSKRIDIVGTGGSARKTFNVSTTTALLLASMGLKVAKHGNRGITSKSGSADLLTNLGININMDMQTCKACYETLGITFLFAPNIHNALKHVQGVRKELGFKSFFNLLGPLSNPLRPTHQLIGVFSKDYTELLANALKILGVERAMVVHGLDGIDEISLCAATQISELKDGEIHTYIFSPQKLGIELANHAELRGGDVAMNAEITLDILSGKASKKADLVALNAGASLYIYGYADSIEAGFHLAREHLQSKKALNLLESFRLQSNMQCEENRK